MENNYYPFVNQPLPYDFDALEPFIDEKTMFLHHNKHLQTYIDNLNMTLEKCPKLQKLSLNQLIVHSSKLAHDLRVTVSRNAGGVFNHRFYFCGLTDKPDCEPDGKLLEAIEDCFGGFEEFKQAFKKAALSVFGSGYAWLVANRSGLKIITTANQNTPLTIGLCPILNIDVWEHAYYLKHYNVRAEYIDDWFNVVNWEWVNKNFLEFLSN